MKKIILMAVAGVASVLFAETTLDWVLDGYAESQPKLVATQEIPASVDTVVFVDAESAVTDVSTEPGGLVLMVR